MIHALSSPVHNSNFASLLSTSFLRGEILICVSMGIVSFFGFSASSILVLIVEHKLVTAEERICLKQYGDAYREYMNRTPRWIGIQESKGK